MCGPLLALGGSIVSTPIPRALVTHRTTTMVRITETSIRFCCPNGHKIRARLRNEGRTMPCPACGTAVVVGAVAAPEPITESGAFRLIEASAEFASTPPEPVDRQDLTELEVVRTSEPKRAKCPRCSHVVDRGAQVCTQCNLLLGSANRSFKHVYQAALQSLMSRR